jgi:phage terminase large subunit GpA-like protein
LTAPAIDLRRIEVEAIRRLCPVTEVLSVTDWADRYRMLPETSTSPGPYVSSVVPYARRPQDCLADPDVTCVALCWAVQTTKSTVLENGVAYRIHRMPSPMVIVQPKIEAAESWAKERLVPMIVVTSVLRERVRLGRSSDSTLRYKRFPGGFIFVASAASATDLASRSAPFVLCDEVDRYEIIPGEGNPVEIVARRQGAADIGLLAVTSTPRDAETTIIWPYLEGGTHEKYEVPCPHCSHMQPLEFSRLKWTKGKPDTVVYLCRACETPISETQKRTMLEQGGWVATNPEGAYPSFHLNALYSPFGKSSWAVLASEWERAQGKPADLQVFVNTRLAELWTETAEVADPDALFGRLESWEEFTVPDGVGVLTFGADVQANRIEVRVWGWGASLESWLVAVYVIPGDPQKEPDAPGSIWHQVDAVLNREYRHASGRPVRIAAGLIDSGFATSQVYRFTRNRRHLRLFASKGIGGEGLKVLGKPTLQGKERVILYPVGVDEAKREFLRSQILESSHGPGFVHLPDWISSDEPRQLTAEKRVRRITRGRVAYAWVKKSQDEPNEALDCRIYARAALEQLGPDVISKLGEYAAALSLPADAPEVAPKPEGVAVPSNVVKQQRGGFVNGWRR